MGSPLRDNSKAFAIEGKKLLIASINTAKKSAK